MEGSCPHHLHDGKMVTVVGGKVVGERAQDARTTVEGCLWPKQQKYGQRPKQVASFPSQRSPSEWPHARVELTKVTHVSLPRPRSRTSFKTEYEASSLVSFYCRGIRSPFHI